MREDVDVQLMAMKARMELEPPTPMVAEVVACHGRETFSDRRAHGFWRHLGLGIGLSDMGKTPDVPGAGARTRIMSQFRP